MTTNNPTTFCQFRDAILDHVREHVPIATFGFTAVDIGPGREGAALTLDGRMVFSTIMDLYSAYQKAVGAAHLSAPLFRFLGQPEYDVNNAVRAIAHSLVERVFATHPEMVRQVEDYNRGLSNRFADLADGMANAMFEMLSANRRKGATWREDNVFGLLEHLAEEVRELREVVEPYVGSDGRAVPTYMVPQEVALRIRREAADVANMAAMVADSFGVLPPPPPREVETITFDIEHDGHHGFARGGGLNESPHGPIFP